jgi:hypothetical protein
MLLNIRKEIDNYAGAPTVSPNRITFDLDSMYEEGRLLTS